jgi:hypothetical protein
MSGDHIVEQHVHNIDVANCSSAAIRAPPSPSAARTRRHTGDQYDFFSVISTTAKACTPQPLPPDPRLLGPRG